MHVFQELYYPEVRSKSYNFFYAQVSRKWSRDPGNEMVPSGRSLSPQNCGVRRHISSIENKIQHGG